MTRLTHGILALAFLSSCGERTRPGMSELSGEAELLLSTTSGEEESMVLNEPSTESYGTPPEVDQPSLFRECDSPAFFERLFAAYDANDSHHLEAGEEDDIRHARSGRHRVHHRMMHHRWHFLSWLYDADDDDQLSDDERTTMLDDHTERCTNIHAAILAEFDLDGDGQLSEAERGDAENAAMERHAEHRERMMAEHRQHMRGKPDREQRPDVPPPVLDEFDEDGDGALSETEQSDARTELRERVRNGEPPRGPRDD
jgi:hypothetical protein